MTNQADSLALVEAFAETSPAMLWLGGPDGRCVFLNRALRRFWGIDPENLDDFDWTATLHPEDVDMLTGPFGEAMREQKPFSVEARYRRADGAWRIMRTEANPRFDASGRFIGMTGVNTDVTEQRHAEEHTHQLMGELNHRTKNILSVVQAIARQTGRSTPVEEFLDTFGARLSGLAASNDLLIRNDWSDVTVDEIVMAQLDPLSDMLGKRIIVTGEPIIVPSQAAQTLGMALHELSTNSLKYGALSGRDGQVDVSWRALDAARWRIEWRETVGHPITMPDRKGFGHTVLVDMVEMALGARVEIAVCDEQYLWTVTAPTRLSGAQV